MTKIAIFGWYGHENWGDFVVLEGLQHLFANCEVQVFTDSPNKVYPLINFKQINKCDLFVLGGGELINTNRLFIPPSWSKHIKIPKIILGCGVNATSHTQLSARVIDELRNFAYIGLRDQTAVDILSQVPALKQKVDLFYDTAYSLNINYTKQKSSNTAVVVPTDRFSNQADNGILEHNVAAKSREWLKKNISSFDNATFLPFGVEDNDDYKTCQQLASCAKNPTIIPHDHLALNYVYQTITNADLVVAYRLHAMILAHILGTPYITYPYHHKLNRVRETIQFESPHKIRIEQKAKIKALMAVLLK